MINKQIANLMLEKSVQTCKNLVTLMFSSYDDLFCSKVMGANFLCHWLDGWLVAIPCKYWFFHNKSFTLLGNSRAKTRFFYPGFFLEK